MIECEECGDLCADNVKACPWSGLMVSGWQTTTTVQQPVFQQWLSQGEWDAIVDDVAKATLPNGVDPKEGT